MRRPMLLALGFLPPVCYAAAPYLAGYWALPSMEGFMLAMAALFLGTPIVSAVLAFFCFKSALARLGAFFGLGLVQAALMFSVVPPPAQVEMLGIAHRLKRTFPVQTITDCASNLVQRLDDGKLAAISTPPNLSPPITHASALVSESELPETLRGRFLCVVVSTNRGSAEVFFEIEPSLGIVCTQEKFSKTVFHHELANGVFAYHYQRP